MADAAYMDAIRPLGHKLRQQRARIRDEVKRGDRAFTSLFVDPPGPIQTLTVERALLMIPRIGESKVSRICGRAQVSRRRKVGQLTSREREAIIQSLYQVAPVVCGRREPWRRV